VIVFKYPRGPERDFIKRTIGIPGDRVKITSRDVFINDEKKDESKYVHFKERKGVDSLRKRIQDNMRERNIGEESFFVLGDNRNNSDDSRFWGQVPRDYLKGRALLIYWSYEASSEEYLTTSTKKKLKHIGSVILHFPTRTRWGRTFQLIR
jgi:signal peptidase I